DAASPLWHPDDAPATDPAPASALALAVLDEALGPTGIEQALEITRAAGESPVWVITTAYPTPARIGAWYVGGAAEVVVKPASGNRLDAMARRAAARFALTRPIVSAQPATQATPANDTEPPLPAIDPHGPPSIPLLTDVPLRESLDAAERQLLLAALRRPDITRAEAARRLGLNRATLYKKAQRFGLDRPARDTA
ncbi:MAG: helix-turn-helix domain-containing protein, partial [Planctomycetota bacterium]